MHDIHSNSLYAAFDRYSEHAIGPDAYWSYDLHSSISRPGPSVQSLTL